MSNLKCPFCRRALARHGVQGREYGVCRGENCPSDRVFLPIEIWQALTQAKQDLATAKADIEDYKKHKVLWEQIRNNTILELERKLKIATKALVFVKTLNERQDGCFEEDYETQMRTVYKALEQIEHKE